MESIVLNRGYIERNYKKIGCGNEASFFNYDNKSGLKLFNESRSVKETLPNKQAKIMLMNNLDIPKFNRPTTLVFDELGNFIGYLINIYFVNKDIPSFLFLRRGDMSLKAKIDLYIKLESQVRLLHQNGVYLIDTNPRNFLIDIYSDPCLIDIDNFRYGVYPNDVTPVCYAEYYIKKTGDTSLKYVDEFSLAIRFLEMVIPGFYDMALIAICNGNSEFIERIIDTLDISSYLKYILLSVVSRDGKKELIGTYLDCISDDNRSYLREM